MGRPKSTAKTVHTAIRLPEELHRKLASVAKQSLADEIKVRLEASLALDVVDEKSKELVAAVVEMTTLVREDLGEDWSKERFVRDALCEAIAAWFGITVREREIPFGAAGATAEKSRLWLRAGDTTEQAGANLVRLHKLVFAGKSEQWSGQPSEADDVSQPKQTPQDAKGKK